MSERSGSRFGPEFLLQHCLVLVQYIHTVQWGTYRSPYGNTNIFQTLSILTLYIHLISALLPSLPLHLPAILSANSVRR